MKTKKQPRKNIKKHISSKIKLMIVDAYGVALHGGYPLTSKYLAKKFKKDSKVIQKVMYDKYFNLAAERKISQKQAWVLALKELSIPTSWKEVRKIHYSFFKVNMPAILCLQSYDCRMLLLSKNTRSQFADTEKKIMFKQHFDRVINTWELKLPKADKKTIHYICRTEHCKPREIVMIDDQASNLIAAKKMGVKTVHFRNIKQCKRELDAIFG